MIDSRSSFKQLVNLEPNVVKKLRRKIEDELRKTRDVELLFSVAKFLQIDIQKIREKETRQGSEKRTQY